MASEWPVPLEGGCSCGTVRYRLVRAPLFIHCCNCHSCQRETGTAFGLNALADSHEVPLIPGVSGSIVQPKLIVLPSDSGTGQLLARCPACGVAVWSHYGGSGPYVRFVRAGTLDKHGHEGQSIEAYLNPDMFIFTKFKQPWMTFPADAEHEGRVVDIYYNVQEKWSQQSQDRWNALKPNIDAWKVTKDWKAPNDIYDASKVEDLRHLRSG